MSNGDNVSLADGKVSLSIDFENGKISKLTAKHEDGTEYDVGFVFEPRPPTGLGCKICRYIGGQLICFGVDCGGLGDVGKGSY